MKSHSQIIYIPDSYEMPVMALRITDWKYCQEFVDKGVIHFSKVESWRDPEICQYGQLDIEEGCFCSSKSLIEKGSEFSYSKCIKSLNGDKYKYYYDSEGVYGCCFYGILLSSFSNDYMTPWHTIQRQMTISHNYFLDFYPTLTKEEYEKKELLDRPGVIFIYDFYKFIDLIKSKLKTLGADETGFFYGPVSYQNKKDDYYINMGHPMEYFLKDKKYRLQHEFRFILQTNEIVKQILERNNGNIEIGDLRKISIAQDFYFKDLAIAIEGSHLIYELPEPKTESIRNYDFRKLASLLLQVHLNILPQGKMNQDEQMALLKNITSIIKEKYEILYDIESGTFHNITKAEYEKLPEWYKAKRPFFSYNDFPEPIIEDHISEIKAKIDRV